MAVVARKWANDLVHQWSYRNELDTDIALICGNALFNAREHPDNAR